MFRLHWRLLGAGIFWMWMVFMVSHHKSLSDPFYYPYLQISLSPTGGQNAQNQKIQVVCRQKVDTEVYASGSKPLNHLQMIDFWRVRHQTLCAHGFHGQRNLTRSQASTRNVDYYYFWKAYDDTSRSLTCSGQLHVIYVEPVPTGQKHVVGSSYLWAGTDHCWLVGLREIDLPANHCHNSCDMHKQGCAQYAKTCCLQEPTTSILRLSWGAERKPFVGRRAEAIPKIRTQKQNPKNWRTVFYVLVVNCGNAPQNWDLIWCSETWTLYFPSNRLQRSATLL